MTCQSCHNLNRIQFLFHILSIRYFIRYSKQKNKPPIKRYTIPLSIRHRYKHRHIHHSMGGSISHPHTSPLHLKNQLHHLLHLRKHALVLRFLPNGMTTSGRKPISFLIPHFLITVSLKLLLSNFKHLPCR